MWSIAPTQPDRQQMPNRLGFVNFQGQHLEAPSSQPSWAQIRRRLTTMMRRSSTWETRRSRRVNRSNWANWALIWTKSPSQRSKYEAAHVQLWKINSSGLKKSFFWWDTFRRCKKCLLNSDPHIWSSWVKKWDQPLLLMPDRASMFALTQLALTSKGSKQRLEATTHRGHRSSNNNRWRSSWYGIKRSN